MAKNLRLQTQSPGVFGPASSFDLLDSNVKVVSRLPAVTFTPGDGTIVPQNVSLEVSGFPDAIIHYTLDGSQPNFNSPVFKPSEPLQLRAGVTVAAFAHQAGYTPGPTRKARYLSSPSRRVAEITFAPPSGTVVTASEKITLFVNSFPDSTIYYTTDGSKPTTNSTIYTTFVAVQPNQVIRAFAVKPGYSDSIECSAVYPIDDPSIVALVPSSGEVPLSVSMSIQKSAVQLSDGNWKYFTGLSEASNPVTTWRTVGYDDSSWLPLALPIWYGDVQVGGTQISGMQNVYSTIYLRKTFTVVDKDAVISLILNARCDDGFIAWVNGVEIARYNVAAGQRAYNTFATVSVAEPIQAFDTVASSPAPSSYLVNGTNVLAIHLFNSTLASTDIVLDVKLTLNTLEVPIYWSLNGSAALIYSSPINLITPGILVAYAKRVTGQSGAPVSGSYTKVLPCPEFNVDQGNVVAPLALKMTVPGFPAAKIHYTTDGSTPSSNSPIYESTYPPYFPAAGDVRAYASQDFYGNSPVTRFKFPHKDESRQIALIADWGDFVADGSNPVPSKRVANLVHSRSPYYLLTVGDNTYTTSATPDARIQGDIVQFYGQDIAALNMFPCWGNHDWDVEGNTLKTLLKYFNYLPGNKRYYELQIGYAHFFFYSTDPREPDLGYVDATTLTLNSIEGQWLQSRVAASTSKFKIGLIHDAPFTSEGAHYPGERYMRYPYKSIGLDIVVSGNDHNYERLVGNDGFPYIITGWGGTYPLRGFNTPLAGGADGATSLVRYVADYGALFLTISQTQLKFEAINVAGVKIDEFLVVKS